MFSHLSPNESSSLLYTRIIGSSVFGSLDTEYLKWPIDKEINPGMPF